nr:trehalose-6-phosphate synthase [Aquabacterium sp. J223]
MKFRTLRLQLRFLLPLLLAVVVASYAALPLLEGVVLRWFVRDLNVRGALVAAALSEPLAQALSFDDRAGLKRMFDRTVQQERLVGVALCTPEGQRLAANDGFPTELGCRALTESAQDPMARLMLPTGPVHPSVHDVMGDRRPAAQPLGDDPPPPAAEADPTQVLLGRLVLLHDMNFVDRRSEDSRRFLLLFAAGLGLAMSLITVAVAQLSWRGWVQGMRAILRGEGLLTPMMQAPPPELAPFAHDLRARLRDLEDDYRRSLGHDWQWTPERLRQLLQTQLRGDQVIVVSNREPYSHIREADGRIGLQQPASGLVTAMEPVVRACSGTWIAHGSGSADREVVDAHDRVPVPPDDPSYVLRRVWMTDEEEQGYYAGFANEGLWPLCHVAHVRPVFRESDWRAYQAINRRFADAVVAEARSEDPIVLVQDYHFALAPAMIRERLPQATIIAFWHIPWPNPESFGICPGGASCSKACWAAPSWASTPATTARTSWRRWTASWRRGWSPSTRPSPSATTRR